MNYDQEGLAVRDTRDYEAEARIDGLLAELDIEDIEEVEEVKEPEEDEQKIVLAMVPVELIIRNPHQPRLIFKEKELKEMAQTIKEKGRVIDPVSLVPHGKLFMLRSGERRWRASKMAGIKVILSIIYHGLSDADVLEENIISDLHREGLTVFELAFAFRRLMAEKGLNQSQLAKRMGKDPVSVSNTLKIFKLHEDIQQMMIDEIVSPGIGLLFASYPKDRQLGLLEAYNKIIESKFNGIQLHPNLAAKVIRKEAEEQGIVPLKPKKGTAIGTHAEMIFRSIVRKVKVLGKEIEELVDLKETSLRNAKKPQAMEVISLLERLQEHIEDELPELNRRIT